MHDQKKGHCLQVKTIFFLNVFLQLDECLYALWQSVFVKHV